MGLPGRVPAGWRCICFTDGPTYEGWEHLPTCSDHDDPVRNAKIHKILAHKFFPNAEYSLWMDGNFEIACDVNRVIRRYLSGADIAVHAHRERTCIYEEARVCIEQEKDSPDTIRRQVNRYWHEGYPPNAGLAELGIILRRHTRTSGRLNECWWAEISRGSRRDQLSFNYVTHKLQVPYRPFRSHIVNGPLFKCVPHAY